MENVPNLRRRRSAGDSMSDDQISTYLLRVRSSLHVPKEQRGRVLDEIESHLDDGVVAYMESGATRSQAIDRVIQELGSPETVAEAFTDETPPRANLSGVLRWLPMVLPIVLLATGVGYIAWSLITLVRGDMTVGKGVVQRTYLRTGLITGMIGAILSYAAYLSIGHADRDRAWRWAAWACTAFVLLTVALD